MAVGGRSSPARTPLGEEALYEYAVRSLGRQMRTVAELTRLLRRRVEADEAGEAKIASAVSRLKERGYLDDTAFASNYARLRQENRSFGRRRVQQELARKGVHRELIADAVDAVYGGQSEEQLARVFVERRRIRKPGSEKETARLVRKLAAAGFSFGAISSILKRWEIDPAEVGVEAAETHAEGEDGSENGGHSGPFEPED